MVGHVYRSTINAEREREKERDEWQTGKQGNACLAGACNYSRSYVYRPTEVLDFSQPLCLSILLTWNQIGVKDRILLSNVIQSQVLRETVSVAPAFRRLEIVLAP